MDSDGEGENFRSQGRPLPEALAAKRKAEKRQRGEGSGSQTTTRHRDDPLVVAFASCKVQPTRFIDWSAMTRLGVNNDLDTLFRNMGLYHYMHMRQYTHAKETKQFFSSLIPTTDAYGKGCTGIKFNILGKIHSLSFADLRKIYGFERVAVTDDDEYTQISMADLWNRTASEVLRLGKTKASNIRNPVIRLAQKALGFSFLGRSNVGPLVSEEWRMICQSLRPLIDSFEPPVVSLPYSDPCAVFVANLFQIQEMGGAKKSGGWTLSAGGMLTPIFRHCKIVLSEPIEVIPLIDMAHLYNSKFLSRTRRNVLTYPYSFAGRPQEIVLPNPSLVSLSDPDNILFAHFVMDRSDDEGEEEDMPRAYGAARYHHPMVETPRTPIEKELVKQVGFLQRWCKWQDRSMKKMLDNIQFLKGKRSSGKHAGESSRREGSTSPASSNPSLDLSPPPQPDHESDAA